MGGKPCKLDGKIATQAKETCAMKYVLWSAFALVLAATNAFAQARAPTIPQRYRGEWVSALKDCGTWLDDTRMVIGVRTIRFYESEGTVRALVPRGNFEITMILAMSAEEDQTWVSPIQLNLSVDGRTLTDTTPGYDRVVRYRCPNPAR
jgi:hypothetical protein